MNHKGYYNSTWGRHNFLHHISWRSLQQLSRYFIPHVKSFVNTADIIMQKEGISGEDIQKHICSPWKHRWLKTVSTNEILWEEIGLREAEFDREITWCSADKWKCICWTWRKHLREDSPAQLRVSVDKLNGNRCLDAQIFWTLEICFCTSHLQSWGGS